MERIQETEEMIDLGEVSIETRGGAPLGIPDVQPATYFIVGGMQSDD